MARSGIRVLRMLTGRHLYSMGCDFPDSACGCIRAALLIARNDLPGISGRLTNRFTADFSFADMLTEQAIQDAVRRVVEAAHAPLKVILFGSYARGSATEGSDLDLLVVEREVPDTGAEMIRLGDALIHLDVGVDLLVYSEEEFNKRQHWCSTPVYWAMREGKVLYDHRQ